MFKAMRGVFFSLIFTSTVAHGETDLLDLYKNSHLHKPYVIFTARDGVPGHAYVILGEELDNGLLWDFGVLGFYPAQGKEAGKMMAVREIMGTPGKIAFKWSDVQTDIFYRVYVSHDQYQHARSVFLQWKEREYSLFGSNCNSFVSEVAGAIGLELPNRTRPGTTLPVNYIKALKEAQSHPR